MARARNSHLYDVAVEPAASALLHAVSKSGPSKTAGRDDEHEVGYDQPLASLFALNFNFKPDSTHDCKRGALSQLEPGRSITSEWQLELESTDAHAESSQSAGPNEGSAQKTPAHVFTGPQTAGKVYDLVLVWDEEKHTYRLDRMAASFALKYERSRTTLSDQGQNAWTRDFRLPLKRERDENTGRSIKANDPSRTQPNSTLPSKQTVGVPSESRKSLTSGPQRQDATRDRPGTVVAPLRRSSRRSVAVEMEEFDDPAPPPKATAPGKNDNPTRKVPSVEPSERPRSTQLKTSSEETSESKGASELRRSRRRSSQQWQPPAASAAPEAKEPTTAAPAQKAEAVKTLEAEEEDLALELERELEREFDLEVVSEDEAPVAVPETRPEPSAEARSARALSPISRLQRGDRPSKISTPKAHTPDAEELTLKMTKRKLSPAAKTDRSTPDDESMGPTSQAAASIGLGLQQTGIGITPTASPHLDLASPGAESLPRTSPEEDADSGNDAFDEPAIGSPERDEDDDDLQDFAAELDMSLAEGPEASPVIPTPVVEKRRSSRVVGSAHTAGEARNSLADASHRNARKAYGLGGPRQEEEDLEDSD